MNALAVSAGAVRRELEAPALEAIAEGRSQNRLIFNEDAGCDSLIEVGFAMRDGADPYELRLLARLCSELRASNLREQGQELRIAGVADALAADLHALERAGRAPALGVRGLAARLRGPLRVLAAPAGRDVLALADAVRAIDAVALSVPRLQLLAPSLRGELGPGRFALLEQLVDRRGETLL